MSRFDECLKVIIEHEKGDVDIAEDLGGRTRDGITQRTYNRYRLRTGKRVKDVFTMDDDERRDIYLQEYWIPCGASTLPAPLDLLLFDCAVLFGPKRAVMWLQGSLGMEAGEIDGILGSHTLLHVSDVVSAGQLDDVCRRYIAVREDYHRKRVADLPSQKKFLEGWLNRCRNLKQLLGAM